MARSTTPEGEPATTRFRVHGTFVLRSRSLFIARGIVVSGAVRAGQRVVHPEGLDAAVGGVEFALLSASGGAEQTALTFRFSNSAELARWHALVPTGVELTLADASPTSTAKRGIAP